MHVSSCINPHHVAPDLPLGSPCHQPAGIATCMEGGFAICLVACGTWLATLPEAGLDGLDGWLGRWLTAWKVVEWIWVLYVLKMSEYVWIMCCLFLFFDATGNEQHVSECWKEGVFDVWLQGRATLWKLRWNLDPLVIKRGILGYFRTNPNRVRRMTFPWDIAIFGSQVIGGGSRNNSFTCFPCERRDKW